jgi:hypothetical protein
VVDANVSLYTEHIESEKSKKNTYRLLTRYRIASLLMPAHPRMEGIERVCTQKPISKKHQCVTYHSEPVRVRSEEERQGQKSDTGITRATDPGYVIRKRVTSEKRNKSNEKSRMENIGSNKMKPEVLSVV